MDNSRRVARHISQDLLVPPAEYLFRILGCAFGPRPALASLALMKLRFMGLQQYNDYLYQSIDTTWQINLHIIGYCLTNFEYMDIKIKSNAGQRVIGIHSNAIILYGHYFNYL